MNSSSKITSLSDIQERKKQIESELEYSQKALVKSVSPTGISAKNLVLQDLIVPALGIGAALFVASRIFSGKKKKRARMYEKPLSVNTLSSSGTVPEAEYQQRQEVNREVRTIVKPKKNPVASLMKLGAIVVPAAQAIMEAVQDGKQNKSY